jgi:ubiquinone/menaquinone biosynthesis C-methylase UbiE
MLRRVLVALKYRLTNPWLTMLDNWYIHWDKDQVRRTRNIRLVPSFAYRRGGKTAYIEWGQVVGIFQTLINIHLNGKSDARILDVGCGTGLLAIACEQFVQAGGTYTGIDVSANDIAFCRQHYPTECFTFQHLNVFNGDYATDQPAQRLPWNVRDGSQDFVTALSVWTHMNEDDAVFYFKEIARVLKPMGHALVTLFLIDDHYFASVNARTQAHGRYHMTPQSHWIFSENASSSGNWRCPKWVRVPENAIGITSAGLDRLLQESYLKVVKTYPGNWKEIPGIYFQDVLIFEKPAQSP